MSKQKKTNKSLIAHADVAIVGAGIVGQTLALLLSQISTAKPLNILVIDAQASLSLETSGHDDFSPRVSAISTASQATLEAVGAWKSIERMQPYSHMQVWEQDGFGSIDFSASEIGIDELGHIIENNQIVHALFGSGQQSPNIEYLLGSGIEQMQRNDSEYHLQLADGKVVVTKLLVGADGGNSFVRKQLGFAHTFWDYDHTAIVANVKTQMAHENTARQAFTATGPLAFLPLKDANQCSIVWSQDTVKAKQLLALSGDDFCKALSVAIDMKLGPCELSTERFSYPLRMRYAKHWVDESVALIGDAAHTIHPLAGQGANLGIGDAFALAQNIEQSLLDGKPFYALQALRKYERFRKAEAQKVIASMEGFKRLFSGNDPIKKLVRNIGLSAANKINPVKQFFIQQAEG